MNDAVSIHHAVQRVLVIGLDGATFDALTPWAESGRMPNLARLMASSALSVLQSTRPYITPVAWTTFQTGCDPSAHGIFDYRYLDHERRRLALNHAGRIACPTLFDAVSTAGGQVVSLNLPMTFPASSLVRGIVVGGLDSPSMQAALEPYPAFAERVRATGARYDLATVWRRRPTSFDELADGVAQTRAVFGGQVAAARVADRMIDWRLMVVQFQALDALAHRCWHLLGVDPQSCEPPAWVAQALHALVALDDCLGELLELASRRGAAVIALSDHGFGPFREKISLAELLTRRGLLRLPRGGAAAGFYLRRCGWKLRKHLWRRFRPGHSSAGLTRPLGCLLPIDWRRSLALALHGNLGGLVYLNTRERFGGSTIVTPRQCEQAACDTIAAFDEARHPETGEKLFDEAYSTAQRFGDDPVARTWPDVVAIPSPGFHTRHKFEPVPRLLRADPALVATHRQEGVLLVDAPGVRVGKAHQADLRDVAPMILGLLGIEIPPGMTGRAPVLWDDQSLGPVPALAVGSRCGVPLEVAQPAYASLGPVVTDSEQATVEARLRDLGYLD